MTSSWKHAPIVTIINSALLALTFGCNSQPTMTPVEGVVLYNGQPLTFGVVMFHPPKGQVAQAEIQSDGSFILSTFRTDDGAVPGHYLISVICYEAHDPKGAGPREDEGGGMWLGKALIPLKYTRANSSGLSADVSLEGPNKIVLELFGPSSP